MGQEDPLEKEMATDLSLPAWKIPWREEPGRLQYMGSQKSWTQLRNKQQENVKVPFGGVGQAGGCWFRHALLFNVLLGKKKKNHMN